MKILVTGINGLVGKDIADLFAKNNYKVIGVGRSDKCVVDVEYKQIDLTDFEELGNFLNGLKPDAIIHCAAYTKLDDCENNPAYASKMNVDVTEFLATRCERFVYVSSDAVFSGNDNEPYNEEFQPNPINYYGRTKYEGEAKARLNGNAIIVRSSLYGYRPDNESAIAEWGLRSLLRDEAITGFSDVKFNPLYSKQFAEAVKFLFEGNFGGIYHLGCSENLSKYDFFRKIASVAGKDQGLVNEGRVSDKVFKAQRTKDTCLNIDKFTSVYGKKFSLEAGLNSFVEDVREAKGF